MVLLLDFCEEFPDVDLVSHVVPFELVYLLEQEGIGPELRYVPQSLDVFVLKLDLLHALLDEGDLAEQVR